MNTESLKAAKQPKSITVFETSDGKRHDTEERAVEWEQWLEDLAAANDMFANGATLLAAVTRAFQSRPWVSFYRGAEEAVVLGRIRKDTKLVISHWQCSNKPAYSVEYIAPNGNIRIGGVGGWAGYYGNDVPASDAIRYALDTFKRFPIARKEQS